MTLEFDLRGIDNRELGRLMELLSGSDVEECEIEQGERWLRVRRQVRPASRPGDAASAGDDGAADGPEVVTAAAVGFFRRAEKRSAPPRVAEGDPVKAGDVLGYIEVMNVPHSVLSTRDGIVGTFLAQDGQPVEYGQPLVAISNQTRTED